MMSVRPHAPWANNTNLAALLAGLLLASGIACGICAVHRDLKPENVPLAPVELATGDGGPPDPPPDDPDSRPSPTLPLPPPAPAMKLAAR